MHWEPLAVMCAFVALAFYARYSAIKMIETERKVLLGRMFFRSLQEQNKESR